MKKLILAIALLIGSVAAIEAVQEVRNFGSCMAPKHLFVKGNETSSLGVDQNDPSVLVITNAVDVSCK